MTRPNLAGPILPQNLPVNRGRPPLHLPQHLTKQGTLCDYPLNLSHIHQRIFQHPSNVFSFILII